MKPGVHQFEDKLLEFAYDELQPHEAEAVDAHVRGCTKCSESLSAITSVRTAMGALPVEAAPAAGLESLLAYAELHAKNNAKPKKVVPLWRRLLVPLSTVMALTTVGVVAFEVSERSAPPDALAYKLNVQTAKFQAPVVVAQAAPPPAPREEPFKNENSELEKEKGAVNELAKAAQTAAAVPVVASPSSFRGLTAGEVYDSLSPGDTSERKKGRGDGQASPQKIAEAKPSSSELFGLNRGSESPSPKGGSGSASLKDMVASSDKGAPKSLAAEAEAEYDAPSPSTPAPLAYAEQNSATPPSAPPATSVKKPSMSLGTKSGSIGSAGALSQNKLESAKRDLDEESRLAPGADDEKQAVRSRVGNVFEGQLSMARAANNRGDRQAELKECLAVLAAEKSENKTRPILNAVLNAGAGNTPTLARSRLRSRAEQLDGRTATAGQKGTLG